MRAAGTLAVALALAAAVNDASAFDRPTVDGARLVPRGFVELDGWARDDHRAAFGAFRRTCEALAVGAPALRPAGETGRDLMAVCARALTVSLAEARRFFEENFRPFEIVPNEGSGFLTGYFEPEYAGSLERVPGFDVPLLSPPEDHVSIPRGETRPGIPPELQAARAESGRFTPYPDRAAIEEGALGDAARPIVWLRRASEAFIVHVQGSARIRLPDGRVVRVAYAGRNGHAYTSIGRILVENGEIPLAEMSLERLMGWLDDNPERGRELMRRNRSFIFFRLATEIAPEDGPIGGAGVPLSAGRSLAVDRAIWRYGLPFWLEGELPRADGGANDMRRLMIAQDTGSAIVGPARGDFYFGSGAAAGTRAGLLRHRTRFTVLLPISFPGDAP